MEEDKDKILVLPVYYADSVFFVVGYDVYMLLDLSEPLSVWVQSSNGQESHFDYESVVQ